MIGTPHQILFRSSNQEGSDGQGMWHTWGTTEIHTGFWQESLTEKEHFEDLGIYRGYNKNGCESKIGFTAFETQTSDRLFLTW